MLSRTELDTKERSGFVLYLAVMVAVGLAVGLISVPKIGATLASSSTINDLVVLPAHGNLTDMRIPLKTLANTQNGTWIGVLAGASKFTTLNDGGHLQLKISTGTFPNGTLVVFSRLTNIGQNSLTVLHLGIGGAAPSGTDLFESYVIGDCSQNSITYLGPVVNAYPNGTVITTSQTFTVDCNQPSFHGVLTLSPGEMFSAYVMVDPSLSNIASSLGSGANYVPQGSNFTYSLQVNF